MGRSSRNDDFPRLSTADCLVADERQQLIRRILSSIHNNSILLIGPIGTGKTSILLCLKGCLADAEDPAMDFYPVYIDLHGVAEDLLFATVADAVLGQLAFAPPSKVARFGPDYGHRDLSRDFRAVIRTLGERSLKPARLVLLVDCIDELNDYEPRTTQRVRSLFMASLAESLVMVASAIEINKHWEQEGSPWYNFFEEIELAPTCSDPGCPG
ncbi:MAG: ATP-binding protein [Acidobacteria bacterium]|nr:ATP-binding protein [Candidatus Sulfomarinibacter kjeldsenii]